MEKGLNILNTFYVSECIIRAVMILISFFHMILRNYKIRKESFYSKLGFYHVFKASLL